MTDKEFQIALLELQRSALIDTQTLFQILIEKDVCSVDEILSKRAQIENTNPDVASLDLKICNLKGESPVNKTLSEVIEKMGNNSTSDRNELMKQLAALREEVENNLKNLH